MSPPAAMSPTCSHEHLQWQKTLNLCKQYIPLLCYITVKSLPLTLNPYFVLVLQGHGEQLCSLQQLFIYLKSIARIPQFFTTSPLYVHYAKQFYSVQHLLAGYVSWICDCLHFYLLLSQFCYFMYVQYVLDSYEDFLLTC